MSSIKGSIGSWPTKYIEDAKIPRKYFLTVFENEVGNCSQEELDKFVVLARQLW